MCFAAQCERPISMSLNFCHVVKYYLMYNANASFVQSISDENKGQHPAFYRVLDSDEQISPNLVFPAQAESVDLGADGTVSVSVGAAYSTDPDFDASKISYSLVDNSGNTVLSKSDFTVSSNLVSFTVFKADNYTLKASSPAYDIFLDG